MLWQPIVTTAPRRVPTFAATMASFKQTGLAPPDGIPRKGFCPPLLISLESFHGEQEPTMPGNLPIILYRPQGRYAGKRLGPWPHFLAAIQKALQWSSWDAIVYFQDDVLFADGLRLFLEDQWAETQQQGPAWVSLYTSAWFGGEESLKFGYPPHAELSGWFAINEDDLPRKAYGACCYAIPRELAERIVINPPGKGTLTKTDFWCGKFCRDNSVKYMQHFPSLVEHIGAVSAIGNSDSFDKHPHETDRKAKKWARNARELLGSSSHAIKSG